MSWLADRRELLARREAMALRGDVVTTPFPPLVGPTYVGAAQGRRTSPWFASRSGVNAKLAGSVDFMRARSHERMDNDSYVWRGVRSYVANLMGTGITPLPEVDDANLAEQISNLYEDWTLEADARRRTFEEGLQVGVALGFLLSGEILARKRFRRIEDGLLVPLQIQLLEADHLPINKTESLPNGNRIVAGIQFGPISNRVGYWLYPEHPNDQVGVGLPSALEPVFVPADQVLHIFEETRPNQERGVPRLSRILFAAWQLDRFDDATLDKQMTAASMTGFLKTLTSEDNPLSLTGDPPDDQGGSLGQIDVGTIYKLKSDQEITWGPTPDATEYVPFSKQNLRKQAAGQGSTYEHMTGDYEGVTYSSLREAKNQLRREIEQVIYTTLVPQYCQPVWEAWFETAVAVGRLPITPREFRDPERRRALIRVKWVAPRMDYVDPQKEVAADGLACDFLFSSRSEVIRARGGNPRRVFQEIAAEQQLLASLGIAPLPSKVADTAPDAPMPARKQAA